MRSWMGLLVTVGLAAASLHGQGVIIEPPPRVDDGDKDDGKFKAGTIDGRKWAIESIRKYVKADPNAPLNIITDKKALKIFRDVVGEWKGQGQPKRGSTQGAWVETSDWEWRFVEGRAALVLVSPQSRVYAAAWMIPLEKENTFRITGVTPDGKSEEVFTGTVDTRGRLTALIQSVVLRRPARIQMNLTAGGDRLVMQYDRPRGKSMKSFTQMALLGYTRVGSGFGTGVKATDCVVTGGKGTRAVMYQGKTYYVCCGGCRDEFNENPAKIVAAFEAKRQEGKAKLKEGQKDDK